MNRLFTLLFLISFCAALQAQSNRELNNNSSYKKVQPGVQVSGRAIYDNPFSDPLKDVTVTLNPGNYSTITNESGEYLFENIPNGTYTLTASTTADGGGINATDALAAANHYNGITILSGLRLSAADVNMSGSVNNTDALLILMKYNAMDISFPKGSWIFETLPVVVSGTSVTNVEIKGICVGDVNGSYRPQINATKSKISGQN